MVDFMRAHGNQPGPTMRPALTGSLAGLLAGLAFLAVLWPTGVLSWLMGVLGLPIVWLAAALHLALSVLVGMIYGLIFNRAADDRGGGWLFGLVYGFLVWLLGPVALLQLLAETPPPSPSGALALIGGHLLYGLVLGLSYPFIHQLVRPATRWMRERAP